MHHSSATPRFEDSDPGVGIMGGDAVITCAADESDISFYSRWERVVFVFPEMAGRFWVIFDGFSWDFVGYISYII